MNFSLIVRHKFWRLEELKCQTLIDPFSRVSHLHKLCIKRREFKQGNYKIVVLSTSCPRGKLIIYFRYNWRMHRATWYNLALILQSCHFHFTLCIHRSILPISRVFIPPAYHKMTVPCISESLGWHVKDSVRLSLPISLSLQCKFPRFLKDRIIIGNFWCLVRCINFF